MLFRAACITPLLLLAACDRKDGQGPVATNDVSAKAAADVDAAMADAQRTRTVPAAQ